MKEINSYTIDELCNEHKEINLRTQEGIELNIIVENGITFVLLPFGNDTEKPEKYGHLSKGIAIMKKVIKQKSNTIKKQKEEI